ncbi:hypothetical protein DH2020_009031 [Rehmannia glutinosa]|uniref:Nucleobase-ascorbate transporter-like protein n=1 Tax=Rehmannia glutinosa TaxID=99300 RepID=A0ABR0X549_REHGL
MEQLQGLEYCIDSNPSWGESIALGFQHYILALGTAVMIPSFLVPLMGGTDDDKVRVVQTLLFIGGINTLLQSLFGTRLPTVIGGSWAFMVPVISIIKDSSLQSITDPHVVGQCVEIGVPMLVLFVAFSQYLKHFQTKQLPVLERFALIISVTVIWAYAHLLTASGAYKHHPELTQNNCRTDRANLISSAPWIKIPYPLQWGAPTFDAGHAFGMMSAVFVSLIESTGAYKAASRLASATPPPAHVLSRGIGWQGIGILLAGLFGTVTGFTVSVENIGLLGSTRVGSRRGNSEHYLHQYLSQYLQPCTALCLAWLYFREYTVAAHHGPAHTKAGWFNDFLNTIFSSSPTVAFIVAVFMDNTLDYKDSAKDRGMPWWFKFRTFKGDSRNEEFYTLPFNLNRFFPPS